LTFWWTSGVAFKPQRLAQVLRRRADWALPRRAGVEKRRYSELHIRLIGKSDDRAALVSSGRLNAVPPFPRRSETLYDSSAFPLSCGDTPTGQLANA